MTRRIGPKTTLLLLALLLVYSNLALYFSSPLDISLTNGDEPHYLIAAHSLYYDHDFDTSNNYRDHDYHAFYNGPALEQHLYNFKGRIIPYHPMLGLPLLIVLPYALAGRVGVLIWLSALMALGLVMLVQVVRRYTTENVAFGVVLFCGLTYPLVIYSQQIYPDAVAFTLVSAVLWLLLARPMQDARWTALLVGVALGLLPHFHFKFILLALVLYGALLWLGRQHWRQTLLWSAGPLLLLGLGFLAWLYHIYGELSPAILIAPSRGEFGNGRVDGLLGLWFDQEYGLLFFAPIYVVAVVGAWAFWRAPATRWLGCGLTVLYASQHLLAGLFYDWHGGLSPVPRYLVPVLPVLLIFVAKGVETLWAQRQWSQLFGLALVTLWLTRLILFVHRSWMFGYEKGSNTILRDHYHLTWLLALLPSFEPGHTAGVYVKLGGLLLFSLGLWGAGVWLNRWLAVVGLRLPIRHKNDTLVAGNH